MSARLITSLNVLILVTLAYLNFYLKNNFRELSVANKALETRIAQEKQLATTLKAEVAYVTSPKYLQLLADKHLKLQNVSSSQIIKYFDQPTYKIEPSNRAK